MTKFHYNSKDIEYLQEQDRLLYATYYPTVSVQFVDSTTTEVDQFRTQPVINYYEAVDLDVLVRFTNLEKVMDKYDLEEVPEAVAVFSNPVINHASLAAGIGTVEADVLITYAGIEWRVTKAFKQDYVGHNDTEFLHWECILERNIRTNQTFPDTVQGSFYLYGVGVASAEIESIYSFDTKDTLSDTFLFTAEDQKCYIAFPDNLGDLTDIQNDQQISEFSSWTKRSASLDGTSYTIYETNDLRTVANQQYIFIR